MSSADDQGPDLPEYSYQARRHGAGVDPAMRRMVIAAGGISALIITVALVWSGVRPRLGFGAPPVIAAPATPLRVAPADPGGLTLPGANEQIMSSNQMEGPVTLAPSAPAPDIQQLQAATAGTQAGTPGPTAGPVANVVAPPPPAATTASAGASASASGAVEVQLGATPDEAGVHKLWQSLSSRHADDFAGKTPQFIPAVVNGNHVWRLRLGGFADNAAAKAFCATLTGQGMACQLASF